MQFDVYAIGESRESRSGSGGLVNGKSVYHAYLPADDVPQAIRDWLVEFNDSCRETATPDEALKVMYVSPIEMRQTREFKCVKHGNSNASNTGIQMRQTRKLRLRFMFVIWYNVCHERTESI